MITLTRIGISIFAITVVFGPLYTVKDYSFISNLISELGAQHTKNNFIMNTAFVILGGTIVIEGLKKFQISLLPFILFGSAMAVVGIFPHKPLDPSLAYNSNFHHLHGIMASIAGTLITINFYMALIAIAFPLLMLFFTNYQGIIQRAMYLQIFVWLWIKYPQNLADKQFNAD